MTGDLPARYGSRFFVEGVPTDAFPADGMSARDAYELISEEVALDGDPARNLATFVTTWMEPEAQQVIGENLHRNFIDHAEYPRTADIEKRCIRMLGDLYNATGEVAGARCQGSSEAVMLGGLAAKWRWRKAREAAGEDASKPNLVFGRDAHVVWDKFCRYFDVEPRVIPMSSGQYVVRGADVAEHVDENTIAVVAVLGTTYTGESDDVTGIASALDDLAAARGIDVPLHIDAASGGFVWPFLHPEERWDFRIERVASINVSGHKFGMVYPGIGWLVFRDPEQLPEELVFEENYLGETDSTFTLNFSTGSSMMLAQYYNFCRFGRDGYRRIMEAMEKNADFLRSDIFNSDRFERVASRESDNRKLPIATFRLSGSESLAYDEFDVAAKIQAVRGWMVPAYSLPKNAQDETIMRALVKENVSHSGARTLVDDLVHACKHLDEHGGLHRAERARAHSGHGY
ncbi:glutamate decarboxylase [Thermoleophilia bacterium SCSIO 60948]|nr:glutamate decarboxylase [Thermoleophilia bacterium SCSIO 60948]